MTCSYVLDQNIIIFALKGENKNRSPDRTCLSLLVELIGRGHRLVFSDDTLELVLNDLQRYREKKDAFHPEVVKLLMQALIVDGKVERRQPDPSLYSCPAVKNIRIKKNQKPEESDRAFAVLAIAAGARLVTGDPHFDELKQGGKVRVLTAVEAYADITAEQPDSQGPSASG